MSTFLTPPVWYDENGNLNEMLTGNTESSNDIAIGSMASASGGGITIGGIASDGGIAIGENASGHDGIAIGHSAIAGETGAIAIGNGAHSLTPNTIQLGNNNTAYTLNVGNGTGTINGVRLSASGGVIQLGSPNSRYDLKIGAGNGVVDGYIREGLYVPTSEEGFNAVTYDSDIYIQTPINGGIYIIRVQSPDRGTLCSLLFEFSAYNTTYSLPFNYYNAKDGTVQAFIKAKPHDNLGKAVLEVVDSVSNTANILRNFEISVRLISQKYGTG